jgi:hypothetical protein
MTDDGRGMKNFLQIDIKRASALICQQAMAIIGKMWYRRLRNTNYDWD